MEHSQYLSVQASYSIVVPFLICCDLLRSSKSESENPIGSINILCYFLESQASLDQDSCPCIDDIVHKIVEVLLVLGELELPDDDVVQDGDLISYRTKKARRGVRENRTRLACNFYPRDTNSVDRACYPTISTLNT